MVKYRRDTHWSRPAGERFNYFSTLLPGFVGFSAAFAGGWANRGRLAPFGAACAPFSREGYSHPPWRPLRFRPKPDIHLRPATPADLDALVGSEARLFDYDQMSRRSFRRLVNTPTASLLIAEHEGAFAGYARWSCSARAAQFARLYPRRANTGVGVGPPLAARGGSRAGWRHCTALRLEGPRKTRSGDQPLPQSPATARGHRRPTTPTTATRFALKSIDRASPPSRFTSARRPMRPGS